VAQTPSNPPADGSATTSAVIARLNERHLVSEEAQRIASVGIWRYDYVTERVTWSDEMYRIFGLSSESFQPTFENFLACVHPDDREAMVAADRESGTGKPMNFEHRIVRPDGEVRFVHEQAQVVVHDELGGHPLLLGTTQDITERKRAEETVAAQRAKLRDLQARMNGFARQQGLGTMAQNLAHEINQPLTAISNYAFSLRRLGPDSVSPPV
jgi:PAS domain S-box-containing protein